MRAILDRIKGEPALLVGVVLAVLALAGAFGLDLTTDQHDAIVGAIWAGLALAGAAVTRSQVTPSRDVVARVQKPEVGTVPEVVAGPAHPAPTGTPVTVPDATP